MWDHVGPLVPGDGKPLESVKEENDMIWFRQNLTEAEGVAIGLLSVSVGFLEND